MPRSVSTLFLRRHLLAGLGAGLLMWSTACAPKARTEVDPGYDFAAAKTYAWIIDDYVLIEFGTNQPKIRTKENEERLRTAIDRELAARGFTKVPREEAALLVAFSVGVKMRYRLEGGNGTAVTTDGPSEEQTKGTLNIYLLDRESEKEVWHGWSSRWLGKDEDPQTVIDNAVARVMAEYAG